MFKSIAFVTKNGSRSLHSSSLGQHRPHLMSKYLVLTEKPFVKENYSKSFALLRKYGFIDVIASGLLAVLPLCTRALEKLTLIISQEMDRIGGQKTILPSLASIELLKTSGKWSEERPDIFTLHDRHGYQMYLAPTHEEIICQWLSKENVMEKRLPILLYQITSKFRDEARARSGLLRAREFTMKDLYTYDASIPMAQNTYDTVCQGYLNIFERLNIDVVKVSADPGTIGGKHSHEFHIVSEVGEDTIYFCQSCKNGYSEEFMAKNTSTTNCKKCESCGGDLVTKLSIEVGHAFLLGTRYTEPFKCFYQTKTNENELLQMGCYGLGVTRILSACLEILSTDRRLRWPLSIAPYQICVIPPKAGSKEEQQGVHRLAEDLASHLVNYTSADVVIDDRSSLTIGERVFQSKCWGLPILIVVGKKATQSVPIFEMINTYQEKTEEFSHIELMDKIKTMFPK